MKTRFELGTLGIVEGDHKRTLVLLDDREFGEVGRVDLYWDKFTTQFNEV